MLTTDTLVDLRASILHHLRQHPRASMAAICSVLCARVELRSAGVRFTDVAAEVRAMLAEGLIVAERVGMGAMGFDGYSVREGQP